MHQSELTKITHQHLWRHAYDFSYSFRHGLQPRILEEIDALRKRVAVKSLTDSYELLLSVATQAGVELTETLADYIVRKTSELQSEIVGLNQSLEQTQASEKSVFDKLNDFREENSMSRLISLGSSPAEDFSI